MKLLVIFLLLTNGVFGWLDDFKRRKNADLTNLKFVALPHVLLKYTFNTEDLISKGKMRSDCLDLLVTNVDDEPFEHWLEGPCGFPNTTIWINVTDVFSFPTKTRVRVYYGSSSMYPGKYPAKLHWKSRFGLMSRFPCSSIGMTRFSELDGYFVMGNSSEYVNEEFGSTTHEHAQAKNLYSNDQECTSNPRLEHTQPTTGRSQFDHGHRLRFPDASVSSRTTYTPKNRRYSFCYPSTNDSFPFSLPDGTLGFFETTDSISDWTSDDILNNNQYFLISSNTSILPLETYDPPSHRHTIDVTGITWSDVTDKEYCSPGATGTQNSDVCVKDHSHDMNDPSNSNYQSDASAPYCNLFGMYSTTNTSTFPSGMITFQVCGDLSQDECVVPPLGWRRYHELDGYFPRGSSTSLKSCGLGSHQHSLTISTTINGCDYVSTKVYFLNENLACSPIHTHSFPGSLGDAEILPPHKKLRYLIRLKGDNGDKVSIEVLEGEDWKCFGISKENDSVCSHRNGVCVSPDVCVCDNEKYNSTRITGLQCQIFDCFGFLMNDTDEVCSAHGVCESPDVCECKDNFTHPVFNGDTIMDCSSWECFGTDHTLNETVCNGHGNCSSHDHCTCYNETLYHVDEDCGYKCYDYAYNDESEVCSGRGECKNVDLCVCEEGYSGNDCSKYVCFNISAHETEIVCGGNGACVGVDECRCFEGFYTPSGFTGVPCSSWSCYGVHKDVVSSICSSRGTCKSHNNCWCKNDYEGLDCETWSCGDEDHKEQNVCSGNGKCKKPNDCKCDRGYRGKLCEENMWYYTVLLPSLGSVGVGGLGFVFLLFCVCACCAIFICCFLLFVVLGLCIGISVLGVNVNTQKLRLDRFGELKNFDLLMKEQELDEDTTVAHLRIKQELFKIDIDEITIKSILGEGGSNSVVYKSEWNGSIVAFKCFRTRSVFSNQQTYDEFEREVEVLASINHPGIIQFFGCSMQHPRIGIVMEFCEKGDLNVYIQNYEIHNGKKYPLKEKCRMALEISLSLEYLHSRNIIHRDLKMENVLVNFRERTKLMDFGVSKIIEREGQNKTKKIGTSYYMAPEIVLSTRYDEKCDVFSYSILLFILFTENFFPYKETEFGSSIEFRVANDPQLRPDIEELDTYGSDNNSPMIITSMREIVLKSWSHNPNDRDGFSEISKKIREAMAKEDSETKIEKKKEKKKKGKKKVMIDFDDDDDNDEDNFVPDFEEIEGEDNKVVLDSEDLCKLVGLASSKTGEKKIEVDKEFLFFLLDQASSTSELQ